MSVTRRIDVEVGVRLPVLRQPRDLQYPWPLEGDMSAPVLIPLPEYREYPEPEMVRRAAAFFLDLQRRRRCASFRTGPSLAR